MRRVVTLGFAALLLGFAVFISCSDPKTVVLVHFIGTPVGEVAKVSFEVDIAGNKKQYEITEPQPVTFPRDFRIEVEPGLQGLMTLTGACFDANGLTVSQIMATGIVVYQKTLEVEAAVGPVVGDGGTLPTADLGPFLGTAKLQVAGPSMKDFGTYIIGVAMPMTPPTWTVTLFNEGPDPTGTLSIMGTKIMPPIPDGGAMDGGMLPYILRNDNCSGKKFNKQTGCSFDVQFNPKSVGMFADTITVTANPGGTVQLAITGIAATNDM